MARKSTKNISWLFCIIVYALWTFCILRESCIEISSLPICSSTIIVELRYVILGSQEVSHCLWINLWNCSKLGNCKINKVIEKKFPSICKIKEKIKIYTHSRDVCPTMFAPGGIALPKLFSLSPNITNLWTYGVLGAFSGNWSSAPLPMLKIARIAKI